ncbi:helix-turn-helix domain-containing protein [Winogradskyella immobilis]|uniref:Helix-turn-helix transcriptional regulator n=1 Tax=Winogradskyella immobilis TaxID=2816852 RepID=A0ABS8ENX1_9FLAO|nr:AraC family transcriptional regulator [Winogradskyella immobilis]MCC1484930.1 helix-turn-helix transcriptional regulator [Winogradskyella immobilis]MCG0017022.1 AraC family transcriptional regulator [Winogradskyella immobilis]
MQDNFIIHQQAYKYQWTGDCFLSIKSFYGGKADYKVKQREYRVDKTNFLILNECTKYRLTIDTTDKTESFCVFFSPNFVSKVYSELNASDKQLLDFNFKRQNGIKLLEMNYPNSGIVSELLKIGRNKSNSKLEALKKDEFYHQLLNAVFYQNNGKLIDTERLDSKKKSTREELYQRVVFVKDFLDCNYHKELRLRKLAEIGLLSENHLLRSFNQIFGMSPFQYISQKRIKEAKRQILESNKSIKNIALDVGYSSPSNFSSYFKTIVGKSPSAMRKSDI